MRQLVSISNYQTPTTSPSSSRSTTSPSTTTHLPFVKCRRAAEAGAPSRSGDSRPCRRRRILRVEDPGDVTLQAHLGVASLSQHDALYQKAIGFIELLPAARAGTGFPACRLPVAFDRDKLIWSSISCQAFPDGLSWGGSGAGCPRCPRRGVVGDRRACRRAAGACHRDYHSRNLMLHAQNLYIIDFQDARMGPDTYDLASLLRDSYVDLSEETIDTLIHAFPGAQRHAGSGCGTGIRGRFDLMSLQRIQGARHVRSSDHRAGGTRSTFSIRARCAMSAGTSSVTRGSRGCARCSPPSWRASPAVE